MDGEWRVIAEFPKYPVSSTGSVRNNVTGRILKAGKNSIGYLYVDLYSEDNHKSVAIHKLKVNCISRCCLGKRKTYKGYNWRFKL